MATSLANVVEALAAVGIRCDLIGDPETEVRSVTHDSRSIERGVLFACLRGDSFDGHDFAAAAVDGGASALLVDHRLDSAAPQIVVADTRRALGPVAAAVAGHPSRRLTTVGITGTNGKTTVAQLVGAILDHVDRSAGIIGTLHGPRTTPEAPELQAALETFIENGRTSAVLEVSSHALALHRIDGTVFDVVAFTNFGHDHLDLHGTPEEYFRAKSQLFDARFADVAVIHVDDPHGRVLADAVAARTGDEVVRVVEVSDDDLSDVVVEAGTHSYTWRNHAVSVPIGGDFNVSNSHVALTIATEVGVDAGAAVAALAVVPVVPGRFERVTSAAADDRGISVIVDYAHTPDGLEQVLSSARGIVADVARVVVVFGCGGERDRDKRPAMGAAAARLADIVVVTSDNPRGENPQAIIDDILGGIGDHYGARITSDPDRRAAISEALDAAQRGDIVVIAGKGHEGTQDLGDTIIDFDDRQVARTLLATTSSDTSAEDPTCSPF